MRTRGCDVAPESASVLDLLIIPPQRIKQVRESTAHAERMYTVNDSTVIATAHDASTYKTTSFELIERTAGEDVDICAENFNRDET